MDTKEFLGRAETLERLICSKRERIRELREKQTSVGAVISSMRVQASRQNDRLEALSIALMEEISDLLVRETELSRTRQEIERVICELPILELRYLLELRFLRYKKLAEIADEMHYSERQIQRLYCKAILAAENILTRGCLKTA